MIKLKFSDSAIFWLRGCLEMRMQDVVGAYICVLEHDVIARLLKRKLSMFTYPKSINTLKLSQAEAAVIYKIMSYEDTNDISLQRKVLYEIGRKSLISFKHHETTK
jgi:hypothetical protein